MAQSAIAIASTVMVLLPTHAWGVPLDGQVATPSSGVVGMNQSVSVIAPTARNRSIALTATQGARAVNLSVAVNRTGVGRTTWAPPIAGSWLISATQPGIQAAQVAVAAMPTRTQIAVPTNPTQHRFSPLIATVEVGDADALKQAGPITGRVVFTEVVRGVIGEAQVQAASDGTGIARLEWAPPGVATYAVSARFVPADGPFAYASSSSALSTFTAGIDPSPIQLLMPQIVRLGDLAYVAVHVDDERRGLVSLEVDGRKASLDQPLRGDLAEFAWTPLYGGLTNIRVIFHEVSIDRTRDPVDGRIVDVESVSVRHFVEQTINVLEPLPRNPISISPVVKGADEQPWLDEEVVEYAAASRVPLVSSTGSGSPVVFRVIGSCAISGQTLLTPVTGGGCVVVARTPGGEGFQPGTLRVIVSSPVE